jgi:hypothetical protein
MYDNMVLNLDEYNNIPIVDKTIFNSIVFVNEIILRNIKIYYNDDYWDFSNRNDTVKSNWYYTFNFQNCCDNYRKEVKEFILIELMKNKRKIPQVKSLYNNLIRFCNYLNNEFIYIIDYLSVNNIINYLDRYNSEKNSMPSKVSIHNFLEFYEAYYGIIFSNEIHQALKINNAQVKAERDMAKTPDIPSEYFDQLLALLLKLRDKEDLPLLDLICVSYLIIQTQTGLHSSEVVEIPYNCLKTISSKKYGTIDYLTYVARKGQRNDSDAKECITYVNNICLATISILKTSLKQYYKSSNPKYLFAIPGRTQIKPIMSISKQVADFFYKYSEVFPSLDLPDDYYPKVERHSYSINGVKHVLIYPSNLQFRVHVITELYFVKKIPIDFIQKYMNHLTSEMTTYYIRPGLKQLQENMPFTKEILKDIVTSTVQPLGPKAESLVSNINDFINRNNYNIAINLEEIISKLAEDIPIRQKAGGVCIKSSKLRDCAMDAITNDYYCAYGVCPNIYHFYYMIGTTYIQIIQLLSTININKSHNNLRQAYKECKMLDYLVRTRFEVELKELKNEIQKKGASNIIERYPEIKYIVQNISKVEGEIEEWKQMKI